MKNLFKTLVSGCVGSTLCCAFLLCTITLATDDPPLTGPETEKRFPPLHVPDGFKATLFACDPLIEYTSAIALGPKPNSIFVAIDYMTGLGTEIVRRDEIRLVEDTDGDGYADKATVYADGFNSIEGLTFHDGVVYAMHSPFLTALKDTDGDGVADQRRDLLDGLGLPPEENPPRLHCANGIVMGHDGWLYLALGDHGCNLQRPEGDRLVLEGGGILRCRPDGRDLHVFATGLRNIYDVALDDELNVFVRDNENDGGDYKIRVCHSFFGADHGYPYLYYERPGEALPPLADLGLGSSAGGLCYLETQFPPDYRGNLFFCEWGRAVMRYVPERTGSGFAPIKEIEFAAGANNDPYGFKPTDLVVERDGSLIVADWADGQRPRRGRGRIYRIRYSGVNQVSSDRGRDATSTLGTEELLARLDSESYYNRVTAQETIERDGAAVQALLDAMMKNHIGLGGRLHAVWALAHARGKDALNDLFALAKNDPDPRVRAQAVRAIADLSDPVLSSHRLDAGRGEHGLAKELVRLENDEDPRVILQVIIALGRLQWEETPSSISLLLQKPDQVTSHAATHSLRRASNSSAVLNLLDGPDDDPVRSVALRAIAEQFDIRIVDGLRERLRIESDPIRRREYADLLSRIYKKPGPWVYWGYRPAPRPPNSVVWEKSHEIELALDAVLRDPDRAVRLAVLRRMLRERVPTRRVTLENWLADERDAERVTSILDGLDEHPAEQVRGLLSSVVRQKEHASQNRLAALASLVRGLDAASEDRLLELAGSTEDGSVLAEVLRCLAGLGVRGELISRAAANAHRATPFKPTSELRRHAEPLLLRKLRSADADVRAAALEAVAELEVAEAGEATRELLRDDNSRVRSAAASAVGKLRESTAAEPLLNLTRDHDPAVRRASLDSLRLLGERRAVPLAVAALADHETQLAALACLGELGGPVQADALVETAKHNPSAEVLAIVVRSLSSWRGTSEPSSPAAQKLDRAVADVQGTSGILLQWNVLGPLPTESATQTVEQVGTASNSQVTWGENFGGWHTRIATGIDARLSLDGKKAEEGSVWVAYTDLGLSRQTTVQFLSSANGQLRVRLNGRPVYERITPRNSQADSDRFDATLEEGLNRVIVQVTAVKGVAEFQVRFRPKSSSVEQEQLAQSALARAGNVERGRKLFFDAEKSLCIKCHRLGEHGEQIGPELTGVGGRFSRIHIIESILEPSRTVATGFQSVAIALKDGRILTGIKVAEIDATLTLADNQAQKHVIARSDIEELRAQPQSAMPDGLETRFTTDEFVDLVEFLVSQRDLR